MTDLAEKPWLELFSKGMDKPFGKPWRFETKKGLNTDNHYPEGLVLCTQLHGRKIWLNFEAYQRFINLRLFWGYFQIIWQSSFWGHWGQRTFVVEFWDFELKSYAKITSPKLGNLRQSSLGQTIWGLILKPISIRKELTVQIEFVLLCFRSDCSPTRRLKITRQT